MKHTAEPWGIPHFASEESACECGYIFGGGKDTVTVVGEVYKPTGDWLVDDELPSLEEAIANARRLVACVNGCEGIPDEELEKFFKWAKGMWFRNQKLVEQERKKLAKMNDKERAEYEARREATLDYNLKSLRMAENVEKTRQ